MKANKLVSAVCHAPVAFINVHDAHGQPLVRGKHVTGFTNEEEEAMGLTTVVSFLLEDKLKERGGIYSKTGSFAPYVQIDGKLVTGQSPASSGPAAEAVLQLLRAGQSEARA